MTVLSILQKMGQDEDVIICDGDVPIDRMYLYKGAVEDIHRDATWLSCNVGLLVASDDTLIIEIAKESGGVPTAMDIERRSK